MTDETNQAPEVPVTDGDSGDTFDAAYVAKLRQEAAKYRTQLREAEGKVKDLTPKAEQLDQLTEAQKTESQKMADQLAKLTAQLDRSVAEADMATKRAALVKLAVRAGADPDIADLLDLSRVDLSNEEATMAIFAKLVPAGRAAGGNAANPARTGANATETDTELRDRFFGGGQKSKIFGG